jgi:hypothetical protein
MSAIDVGVDVAGLLTAGVTWSGRGIVPPKYLTSELLLRGSL